MAAVRSGHTQTEVAALFGVSLRAVQGWVARTRHGGLAAIQARPRGRPKGTRLSAEQTRQVIRRLRDKRPDQLKLPFDLWTREAVVQLIEQGCGVKVSVWTAGRYLKAWGFTPQKPVRQAYERNPRAVRRWLREEYPAIRAQAKREKAEIYWGDEKGVRSDYSAVSNIGNSWMAKERSNQGRLARHVGEWCLHPIGEFLSGAHRQRPPTSAGR
jgi:transposase